MLCSLLCPVIAMIAHVPFAMYVFRTLWFVNLLPCTVVKATLFYNCFHEFTLANWLLGVPQCWLRFFQVSEIQWTMWAEFCWTLTHFTQHRPSPDRNTCCMTRFTSPPSLVFVSPSSAPHTLHHWSHASLQIWSLPGSFGNVPELLSFHNAGSRSTAVSSSGFQHCHTTLPYQLLLGHYKAHLVFSFAPPTFMEFDGLSI